MIYVGCMTAVFRSGAPPTRSGGDGFRGECGEWAAGRAAQSGDQLPPPRAGQALGTLREGGGAGRRGAGAI